MERKGRINFVVDTDSNVSFTSGINFDFSDPLSKYDKKGAVIVSTEMSYKLKCCCISVRNAWSFRSVQDSFRFSPEMYPSVGNGRLFFQFNSDGKSKITVNSIVKNLFLYLFDLI